MSCQHPGCSLEIFIRCTNHCTLNLCLEHVIEHGDMFLSDFAGALDRLDNLSSTLIEETTAAVLQVSPVIPIGMNLESCHRPTLQIDERRQNEIARVNRTYDERQEEIQKRLFLAENIDAALTERKDLFSKSGPEQAYQLAQHDLEQIKIYAAEISKQLYGKEIKTEQATPMEYGISSHHSSRHVCRTAERSF
jgi:hypothetical protein